MLINNQSLYYINFLCDCYNEPRNIYLKFDKLILYKEIKNIYILIDIKKLHGIMCLAN